MSGESRPGQAPARWLPSSVLSARRRVAGWVAAVLGPTGLAALLVPSPDDLTLAAESMAFLAVTVLCAIIGGLWPAVCAAVLSTGLLNWFFTPPERTLFIDRRADLVLLLLFLLVAVAVSWVVGLASRRTLQADEARREADALIDLNRLVLRSEQDLGSILRLVMRTFGASDVALLRDVGGTYVTVEAEGERPPTRPDQAAAVAQVGQDHGSILALRGVELTASDRRVLTSFAGHLSAVLERRELSARAARTQRLEEGTRVRNALLAAISHDLRTPLSHAKAAVSSLRSRDVTWSAEDEEELLATIEESTDRLHAIVSNLLDLSRIQSDAVTPVLQEVALEDVVARALDHTGHEPDAARVEVRVATDVPQVSTDVGLLERVLANLLDNALRHSPADKPVTVAVSHQGGRVELHVIDRGPGVPDDAKVEMFRAFRRLGDGGRREGLGLGLSVAQGLTEAMAGHVSAQDTPGGGLTVIVDLPAATTGGAHAALGRETAR